MARIQMSVPVDENDENTPHADESGHSEDVEDSVVNHRPDAKTPAFHNPAFSQHNMIKMLSVVGIIFLIVFIFVILNDRNNLEQEVKKLSTTQTSQAQSDAQKYQEEVAKLVAVPEGATPQVEVPNDQKLSQLKQANNLYQKAIAGDAFLVYNNPDKSIFLVVYRPSTKRVILAVLDTSKVNSETSNTTTQPNR